MSDHAREKKPKKGVTVVPPMTDPKKQRRAEEGLREQAKTEVEERPYLDTEGGE